MTLEEAISTIETAKGECEWNAPLDYQIAFDMAIDALKGNLPKFPCVLGQPAEIFFEGEWVRGKIVDGYRFRDGVVTIETDEGKRIWCGQSRTDLYREVNENDE